MCNYMHIYIYIYMHIYLPLHKSQHSKFPWTKVKPRVKGFELHVNVPPMCGILGGGSPGID